MDTSKEYIKMCEKAKEIQEEFQQIVKLPAGVARLKLKGYYLASVCDGNVYSFWFGFHLIDNILNPRNRLKNLVWLPRPDQLQEMLGRDCLAGFIYDLYEFTKENLYNGLRFTSTEQLLLTLVMQEKYNKQLQDGEWVKEK